MVQEVTNFARFYALFNKLAYRGDREEFKKSIVLQYTVHVQAHGQSARNDPKGI